MNSGARGKLIYCSNLFPELKSNLNTYFHVLCAVFENQRKIMRKITFIHQNNNLDSCLIEKVQIESINVGLSSMLLLLLY